MADVDYAFIPKAQILASHAHANLDKDWGPFQSKDAALQSMPNTAVRKAGKKFGVVSTVGGVTTIEEYMFTKDNATDNDIVKLVLSSDDVTGTFDYTIGSTTSEQLSEAIGANKIITIGTYIASVGRVGTSSSGYYVVCYTDEDGVFHKIVHGTSTSSVGTETTKEFVEVSGNLSATGNIASAGFKNYQGDKVFDIGGVDTNGTLHNKIKNAVHADVDTNNDTFPKTFAVKNIKGDTIGSIALSTAASGAAVLTFADNNNGSFVATLPNLRYDSDNQMLKMVDAGGSETNLIKISNLQIKEVAASTSALQLTPTLGDLVLIGDNTNGYELNVFDGTNWQPIGSIDNVSLVADQVGLSSTKLDATNVKGGLEELYDKIDGVGASYWTGSIGISSATLYSNVSGLTEYNKQSEPIDVYVTTVGYLWIVSSVKIIAETSGIEIPMLAPVKSGDFYYYRSEEVVKESISVMVKALAKQEGTDPNDSVTISGSIGSDATYIVGDTATALSVVAASNNGGSLQYEWEKNFITISGANSSTYTPSTSSASDSGTYRCKVTNLLDNGYEYTNIVVIEVKESQGGDTPSGEGWLEGYAIQNKQIVENTNYVVSPIYTIANLSDEIVIHVGYNNSDSSFNVVTLWNNQDDSLSTNEWSVIPANTRLLQISATSTPSSRYMRVVFRKDNLNKCFIYNKTAASRGENPWIYKGSALGNTYDGFEFYKYSIGTNSAYSTIKDWGYKSFNSDTDNQTYLSPIIALPDNVVNAIANLQNYDNSNYQLIVYTGEPADTGNTMIVFCDANGTINTDSSHNRYASDRLEPYPMRIIKSTHIRIFVKPEYLHSSYVILHTLDDSAPDTYIWKGIDVPNLSNN